jgi:hypothetical protein
MKPRLSIPLWLGLVSTFLVGPARAQETGELSLRASSLVGPGLWFPGWQGSMASRGTAEGGRGFLIDLAGYSSGGAGLFAVLAGPRQSWPVDDRVSLFAQIQAGVAAAVGGDFAAAPVGAVGGGVDVRLTDGVSLRAQVDVPVLLYPAVGIGLARVSLGIAYCPHAPPRP